MSRSTEGLVGSIIIAGGGTAGWLAAAYLNRVFGDRVAITLVESEDIAPIGVGEATVPTLANTMAFLGLDDADWMPHAHAAYKSAIRFVGWSRHREDYWHPFWHGEPRARPWDAPYFSQTGDGIGATHYALNRRLQGRANGLLAEQLVPTVALCKRQLSPKNPADGRHDVRTAYHIDAVLMGRFLRTLACERGVERRVDHIEAVDTGERGIEQLLLRSGERLTADLFIDCTGFRSLLIGEALGERFESDAQHLLCNAAVAIQVPHDPARDGLPPYTTATALSSGWSWNIPLYSRRGTGYVYSQDFLEPEAAEAELRGFLGDAARDADARQLRFRVGRRRRSWSKNCVALGLASLFLEPLESTSIFLIEYALANLVTHFPDARMAPARRASFNRALDDIYEELRDFLLLHYALADRGDTPFWRAAASEERLTDTLRERLALYAETLPVHEDRLFALFRGFSYSCIIDGCGRAPRRPHPLVEMLDRSAGEALLDDLLTEQQACVDSMPSHWSVIADMNRESG